VVPCGNGGSARRAVRGARDARREQRECEPCAQPSVKRYTLVLRGRRRRNGQREGITIIVACQAGVIRGLRRSVTGERVAKASVYGQEEQKMLRAEAAVQKIVTRKMGTRTGDKGI